MKKLRVLLITVLVMGLMLAACRGAKEDEVIVMGVTNLNALHLKGNETDLLVADQVSTGDTVELRDNGTVVWRMADGGAVTHTGDETQNGALTVDGAADVVQLTVQGHTTQNANLIDLEGSDGTVLVFVDGSGNVALEGLVLDLDADNNTSITASTDDQIDIEIGGTDEFVFTAGIFDIGGGTLGRIDLDANNDTSIRSSANDQIDLEINGNDEFVFTAGILDLAVTALARIDFDADNNTSVRSSADDQLEIEVGGADEFIFTAGVFDIGNGTLGRIDLDANDDTSIRSSADDQIDIEIGGADEFVFTAGVFDIGGGTLGRVDLDADNDTSIRSAAGNQIQLEIGAADEYTFTATIFDVNANQIDLDADDDTSITADTDDQIDFEVGGADDFQMTADVFTMMAGSMLHPENATSEGVVFAIYIEMTYNITSVVAGGTIPANADVIDWMVVVSTAFDGSGTDLLTCGIAADTDRWVDDLDVAAAGRNEAGDAADMQQDEWATAFGDIGASDLATRCQYADANNDASAGVATFVLWYRVD